MDPWRQKYKILVAEIKDDEMIQKAEDLCDFCIKTATACNYSLDHIVNVVLDILQGLRLQKLNHLLTINTGKAGPVNSS